jgi:branched-chain amino acid transport system substrate-binding protein
MRIFFKILARFILAAALFVPLFSQNVSAEETKRKPKLGVILPLTGRASSAGEAVRNGVNMANHDLADFFEVIFEDNSLDGGRTVSAVNKLIQQDQVSALIVYASGPSNVAAPIAEASSIPMIGMSVDLNVARGRDWVMIHWASVKNTVDKLFDELRVRSINRVAILSTQSPGVLEIEAYFLQNAAEKGISVIYKEQFLPTEIDFQTPITVLKNKKPEAIFINLYYGQAGLFANKASKIGLKSQFFGPFILDDESEIKTADGALDGAFFANTSNGDLSFEKRYLTQHGKRPVLGAIGAYDITLLHAEAIKKSDGTKTSVSRELHAIRNFKGKIGTYSALANNSFDVPTSIRKIEHGKVILE